MGEDKRRFPPMPARRDDAPDLPASLLEEAARESRMDAERAVPPTPRRHVLSRRSRPLPRLVRSLPKQSVVQPAVTRAEIARRTAATRKVRGRRVLLAVGVPLACAAVVLAILIGQGAQTAADDIVVTPARGLEEKRWGAVPARAPATPSPDPAPPAAPADDPPSPPLDEYEQPQPAPAQPAPQDPAPQPEPPAPTPPPSEPPVDPPVDPPVEPPVDPVDDGTG